MSEDAKAKLKEKMGAAVSEEDLDKVAGGTSEENKELITALYKIDPQGVNALMSSLKPGGEHEQIASKIGQLLIKQGISSAISADANSPNVYHVGGKDMSHADVLHMLDDMIAKKANELGR